MKHHFMRYCTLLYGSLLPRFEPDKALEDFSDYKPLGCCEIRIHEFNVSIKTNMELEDYCHSDP